MANSPLTYQLCEALCTLSLMLTLLVIAHDNARRVKVVVERLALTKELWRKEYIVASRQFTQMSRIAHRHRRLDHNRRSGVAGSYGSDHRLDGRGVEEVLHRVIVGRRSHHDEVRPSVRLLGI